MHYNQLVADAFLALLKERTEDNLNDYVTLLNNRETNSEATTLLGYFGDILYHCGWRSLNTTEFDPIGLALAWFKPGTRRVYNHRGDIDWRYSPAAIILAAHFDTAPFDLPWQPNEAMLAGQEEEAWELDALRNALQPLQEAVEGMHVVMERWDGIYRQIALCESKAGIEPGVGFQSVEEFTAVMLDHVGGWLIPKNPKTWNGFDLNTMFVVPTEVRDLFYGHRTCSLSSFEGYRHYFPSVESYEAWLWTLKSRGHYARVRDMPKYWEVPLTPRAIYNGIEDSSVMPTPPSEPVKPGPRTVRDGVGTDDLK